MQAPDITGRIEYYGLRSLTIGLSGYSGTTESTLYNGINRSNETALATADSSVTKIVLGGLDFRYEKNGIQLRGQAYYISLPDARVYNLFAASRETSPDVGTTMAGFYTEVAFDLFRKDDSGQKGSLIPFVRYSYYNTHQKTAKGFSANPAYRHNLITTGIGWKMTPGAILKADIQWDKQGDKTAYSPVFHAGIGVTF